MGSDQASMILFDPRADLKSLSTIDQREAMITGDLEEDRSWQR